MAKFPAGCRERSLWPDDDGTKGPRDIYSLAYAGRMRNVPMQRARDNGTDAAPVAFRLPIFAPEPGCAVELCCHILRKRSRASAVHIVRREADIAQVPG